MHCNRQHDIDIDFLHEDRGVAWGLTRLDDSKTKPTYADLRERDVCEYPLKGEKLSEIQTYIIGIAKFMEPPATQGRRAEDEQPDQREEGRQTRGTATERARAK